MTDQWAKVDPVKAELKVKGSPWQSIRRLRQGDYLMQMATGGSTSLPLAVTMTKHHMFSMLFTFFKCWYRMGWRPGERMLVFYPKNTYNIDDMVKFNPYSKLLGISVPLVRQDRRTNRSWSGRRHQSLQAKIVVGVSFADEHDRAYDSKARIETEASPRPDQRQW